MFNKKKKTKERKENKKHSKYRHVSFDALAEYANRKGKRIESLKPEEIGMFCQ